MSPVLDQGSEETVEDTALKRTSVHRPGGGPSLPTRSQIAGTLILDFQGSRIVRNQFLLLKPPSLWYFVLAAGMVFFFLLN